jgi:hypothetical protein
VLDLGHVLAGGRGGLLRGVSARGPGILVPTSNTDLLGWCLDRGSGSSDDPCTALQAQPCGWAIRSHHRVKRGARRLNAKQRDAQAMDR